MTVAVEVPTGRRPPSRGGMTGGDWIPTVVLVAILLVAWEVAAVTVLEGSRAFPRFSAVIADVARNPEFYIRNARATVRAAWPGWLVGNIIATALGALAVAIPMLERATLHVAVAITSLPIIALAPIFQISLDGDAPRSALAGLAVFFTTLVGTIVGLRACDRSSIDLIRALGGGRWAILTKARLRAALPDYFTALKISAPAAVLGTIVGEFIGGAENGLGVALIVARAQADPERVWGIALVATAVAGVGYALIAIVGRLVSPWAPNNRRIGGQQL